MTARADDGRARIAADAIARRSYGKLVAFLAARTRDVAAAEDALSEAFAAALADWPVKGCPSNPEAWLLTVARRRLIDGARHARVHDEAAADLRLIAESSTPPAKARFRTSGSRFCSPARIRRSTPACVRR